MPPRTVYFAYGSNLWLDQMARRCPDSLYIGRGILENYKWQINSRGYANVAASPGEIVEGLCYSLSKEDEEVLDRLEGVPFAYERVMVEVKVQLAPRELQLLPVKKVDAIINAPRSISLSSLSAEIRQQSSQAIEWEKSLVLVYLSRKFVQNGVPHEEYVNRLANGAEDAQKLGVSKEWIEKNMKPWFPGVIRNLSRFRSDC
jgi:gamma-glutamylcyclotransferase